MALAQVEVRVRADFMAVPGRTYTAYVSLLCEDINADWQPLRDDIADALQQFAGEIMVKSYDPTGTIVVTVTFKLGRYF